MNFEDVIGEPLAAEMARRGRATMRAWLIETAAASRRNLPTGSRYVGHRVDEIHLGDDGTARLIIGGQILTVNGPDMLDLTRLEADHLTLDAIRETDHGYTLWFLDENRRSRMLRCTQIDS